MIKYDKEECKAVFECLRPSFVDETRTIISFDCRAKASSTFFADSAQTIDHLYDDQLQQCDHVSREFCLAYWDFLDLQFCREPGQCEQFSFLWRIQLFIRRRQYEMAMYKASIFNPNGMNLSLNVIVPYIRALINVYSERLAPFVFLFVLLTLHFVRKMIIGLGADAGCSLYYQSNVLIMSAVLALTYSTLFGGMIFQRATCDGSQPLFLTVMLIIAENTMKGLFLGKQHALVVMIADRLYGFEHPGLYRAMNYRKEARRTNKIGLATVVSIMLLIHVPLLIGHLIGLRSRQFYIIKDLYFDGVMMLILFAYGAVQVYYTRKLLMRIRTMPVLVANQQATLAKQKTMMKLSRSLMILNAVILFLYINFYLACFLRGVLVELGYVYDTFEHNNSAQKALVMLPDLIRSLTTLLTPVNCILMFVLNYAFVKSYRTIVIKECKRLCVYLKVGKV